QAALRRHARDQRGQAPAQPDRRVAPAHSSALDTVALNVVVGITGGIAAYKAVNVVRSLVLAGHDVHVVATDAALRFVGRPTLEAISRNPVHSELYEGV